MELADRLNLGDNELQHRIVLAPMTRIRADDNFIPTDIMAEYYSQRASAGGLLISEAIHISPEGTPIWQIYERVAKVGGQVSGLWSEMQMRGWAKAVEAVHAKGGKFSCQLLHAGRLAQAGIGEHPAIKGKNYPLPPVSSSAKPLAATDEVGNDYNWDKPSTPPRALSRDDILRIREDYKTAARHALSAGFDYVELHAAHGYLVEQFLADGVNERVDEYGGSVENRCRFLLEVVESLLEIVGEKRLGVRLSPLAPDSGQSYFDVSHSDPIEIYEAAVSGINRYKPAYLLLTEPRVGGLSSAPEAARPECHRSHRRYRALYDGVLIGAGGFTPHDASASLQTGDYDAIAFGRWFLANPDLPHRIKNNLPLNPYSRETFYGGDAIGYTDYPNFQQADKADLIVPA